MSVEKLEHLYKLLDKRIATLNLATPADSALTESLLAADTPPTPTAQFVGRNTPRASHSNMVNMNDIDVDAAIFTNLAASRAAPTRNPANFVAAEVVAVEVSAATEVAPKPEYAPNEMTINNFNDIVWYLYNYREYNKVRVCMKQSIAKDTLDRFYSEKFKRQEELKSRGKCGDFYIALESFKIYIIDFIKYEMVEFHDAGLYRDPRFNYVYADDGPQPSFALSSLVNAGNGVYQYFFTNQPTPSISHDDNYMFNVPACFINFSIYFTIDIDMLRTKYPTILQAPFYSYFNQNTRHMSADSLIFKRTNYGEFLQVTNSETIFQHVLDLLDTQKKDARYEEVVAAGLRCLIHNNDNNYAFMFRYIQHFNIPRQLVIKTCTSILSETLLLAVVDFYSRESAEERARNTKEARFDFDNPERIKQERVKDLYENLF